MQTNVLTALIFLTVENYVITAGKNYDKGYLENNEMITEIICDKRFRTIGYTSRKISTRSSNYLSNPKLSIEQKGAIYDRRKVTYCKDCYDTFMVNVEVKERSLYRR